MYGIKRCLLNFVFLTCFAVLPFVAPVSLPAVSNVSSDQSLVADRGHRGHHRGGHHHHHRHGGWGGGFGVYSYPRSYYNYGSYYSSPYYYSSYPYGYDYYYPYYGGRYYSSPGFSIGIGL
jgi:hypothetical protein